MKQFTFCLLFFFISALGFSQDVHFLSKTLQVSSGETFMLPFELKETVKEDTAIQFSFNNQKVKLVDEGLVIANFKLGFVRLQIKQVGDYEIKHGVEKIIIHVIKDELNSLFINGCPVIINPVENSVICGKIHVGVRVLSRIEYWGNPFEDAKLIVNLDKVLNPISHTELDNNNVVFFTFELDSTDYKDGLLSLKAEVLKKTSNEVTVIVQNKIELVTVEAEDQVEKDKRVDRWKVATPKIGGSPLVSGGKFVLNYSANPVGLNMVEIKEDGFYQFYFTGKGDRAGGAFPTVGLYFEKDANARKACRLFSSEWNRVTVGTPIYLKKGSHQLAHYFMNDFSVLGEDRNLFIDKFNFVKCTDQYLSRHLDLKVSFKNVVDGEFLQGEVTIPVVSSWDESVDKTSPRISLFINEKLAREFSGKSPVFKIAANMFKKGPNKIQLKAKINQSEYVESRVQIVNKNFESNTEYLSYQFSVNDAIWNTSWAGVSKPTNIFDEVLVEDDCEIELDVPKTIKGKFQIYLNCRGNANNDSFFIRVDTGEGEGKPILANGWWRLLKLDRIDTKDQDSKIRIKISKDANANCKLWVKELMLEEIQDEDREPPNIKILYPSQGAKISSDEIIVVRAYDDRKLRIVDLKVNGKNLFQELKTGDGFGDFIFVIPKHILKNTGELSVQAIATDEEGNIAESDVQNFFVVDKSKDFSDFEKARLVCQRIVGSFQLKIVASILIEGRDAWLKRNLISKHQTEAMKVSKDTSETIYKNPFDYNQPPLQAIFDLVKTPNPAYSHYVNWIQNHFSTWLNKVRPEVKASEFKNYYQLGFCRFSESLLTSAHSPAMLNYLDQNNSRKGKLNENYAREVMELHTLGLNSGYTQEDVTKLAGLLTGWNTAEEADLTGRGDRLNSEFYFCQNYHETIDRIVIGVLFKSSNNVSEGYESIRKVLEVLSMHPSTAKSFCKKLLDHYVRGAYREADLEELVSEYYAKGGDVGSLLTYIFSKDYFFKSNSKGFVIPPMDFGISVMTGSTDPDIWSIHNCSRKSGFGLYDRVTPDGHPEEDIYYADSNVMLQCWRLSDHAKWHLFRNLPESLQVAKGRSENDWMNDMIQTVSVRMNGESLEEESFDAVHDYFKSLKGQPYQKALDLVTFINKLPVSHMK